MSEFEEVLKAMNMFSLIPLAPRIFDIFDNNRDGTVDLRELLCGLSTLRNSRGDDALHLCFEVHDLIISFQPLVHVYIYIIRVIAIYIFHLNISVPRCMTLIDRDASPRRR